MSEAGSMLGFIMNMDKEKDMNKYNIRIETIDFSTQSWMSGVWSVLRNAEVRTIYTAVVAALNTTDALHKAKVDITFKDETEIIMEEKVTLVKDPEA